VRPSPQIDSVIFSSLFPHGRISSGDTHSTVLVDTNVWLVSRGVEGFDAWKENLQEKRLPSEAIAERLRSAVEEFFWTVPEDCQQLRLRALGNMQELDERSWDELNLRRLDLIEKDIETGLTSVENAELDDLDQRADEHLNAVAPLNWEIFEKLKEVAAKDGITVNLD
jgi:hypothetical protein